MATDYLKIEKGTIYYVNVKWSNGYKSYSKGFNGEQHYENWCDFIESRGGKVTGIFSEQSLKAQKL
tara:strand:+ start:347 stop:544 length:198 start_codon:yes stop_codon:yes gene_type:complete